MSVYYELLVYNSVVPAGLLLSGSTWTFMEVCLLANINSGIKPPKAQGVVRGCDQAILAVWFVNLPQGKK